MSGVGADDGRLLASAPVTTCMCASSGASGLEGRTKAYLLGDFPLVSGSVPAPSACDSNAMPSIWI
jgi:hypothetical protein